jgi:glutamine synthetase
MRFQALNTAQSRYPAQRSEHRPHSAIYSEFVFTDNTMKQHLSKGAYKQVRAAIEKGESIDRSIADQVSEGMKNWAVSMGATHYTHWFQPLTGMTAEKHDAFLDLMGDEPIEAFSGSELIQQEPDASSLPSGGLRNTFEARGYTAWDPSSPAFLMSNAAGLTLCIPTIFISYTGEALDYKTPLLKSAQALEDAANQVFQHFEREPTSTQANLGVEQEYFLVDEALYHARPDLVMSGRTLFGMPPAKGQQLNDHYFGSTPERVHAFMVDLEQEAMKLGIPLKTRHNEVAPAQFECAPIFEDVNRAVDHNQLLMDLIDRIAKRHKFRALLHEKPFHQINGSGKHCNWSISTTDGDNLLSPGETPEQNFRFLTYFINVIKAVHDHADLLRASIANAGNDHRLGANEAPPAIMSIFIGDQLTKVLEEFEAGETQNQRQASAELSINMPRIPELMMDNTDRNRTSPFAFTGNKFELRAGGSSMNLVSPMTALNTMVADQLRQFQQELDQALQEGKEKHKAISDILRRYIKEARHILFEGDNYSEEWVAEAEKRGLSNLRNTPEALDTYMLDRVKTLFQTNNVLSGREVEARYETLLERYSKNIQIESRILGEMALNRVIPPAIKTQDMLIEHLNKLDSIGILEGRAELKVTVEKNARHIEAIKRQVYEMIQERKAANVLENSKAMAMAYNDKVKPYLESIRYHIDKLELNVDDQLWQVPKYHELLFFR